MSVVNYYRILEIDPTASADLIKSQYRKLSLKRHPDHGGTTTQMSELNEGYQTLSNALLRREYDAKLLKTHVQSPTTTHSHTAHTSSNATTARQYTTRHQATHPQSKREARATSGYYNNRRTYENPEDYAPRGHFWRWFAVALAGSLLFVSYQVGSVFTDPSQTSVGESNPTLQVQNAGSQR